MTALGGEPKSESQLRLETGMHTAMIKRIALDAGERWLATASNDKSVRVWDFKSGALLRVLRPPLGDGNEGKLNAVALSPDGARVAAGGWTGYEWDKQHSIYVFDRASGRLVQRLTGLPDVVNHLAWSPDGRLLAAALGSRYGVRLFRTADWQLAGDDRDYGSHSYGVAFDGRGRLAATSWDGEVRLYRADDTGLTRLARQAAPGGKLPYGIAFSPDGTRLAVGFADTSRVAVVDGETLDLLYSPEGADKGSIDSVAWSADGRALYAGGKYSRNNMFLIRRWGDAGRGPAQDLPAADNTVMDLLPLADGGIAFGAADPAWGTLAADGTPGHRVRPATADFRGDREGFRISQDGGAVRFGFEYGAKRPIRFDTAARRYQPDAPDGFTAPRLTAPGLDIAGWQNAYQPALGGRRLALLQNETSRSLAIAPDAQSFVLGTEWRLRRYDRDGRELWQHKVPGPVWAVNVSGDGCLAVAAYGDGTIRWHRLSDGAEVLAFFPHADGQRWVLWTPSGYYDASPGAEDLIGWHFNRGAGEAADFFPASRFRGQFYRPDVVAKALEVLGEAEALRLANLERGRREEAPVAVTRVLPPVLEIVSPADGAATSSPTLSVRYRVRTPNDAPVTALRARVNGQAVSLPEARNLTIQAANNVREVTLPLPAQDSEILLFAENKNGVSTPATLRVTWKGTAPQKADDFTVKPKLYVLAVGVSEYQKPELKLGFAAKDARDFAAALQKQKGALYREVEVKLLTDKAATRDEVVDGLDWLRRQVTPRDIGVVFLAGHGVNDPDGVYYYLPFNTDPEKLKRTGVVFTEIRNTLSTLPGKAVFFVDTCHSGNVLGTGRRAAPTDINGIVNELASAENGVLVFSSSTGRQYSLEDPKWGNGAFTKAVVEGLAGKADINKSGRITHKMLDFYISERVKDLTGGKQSPVTIIPAGVTDFPIAVVR